MAAIKWAVLMAVLGIVAVGCGGGGGSTSHIPSGKTVSIQEIATCMEQGGAKVTKVLDEENGAFQMLYALNAEADFNIVNLADPRNDHRMIKFMEKSKENGGSPANWSRPRSTKAGPWSGSSPHPKLANLSFPPRARGWRRVALYVLSPEEAQASWASSRCSAEGSVTGRLQVKPSQT